MKVVKKSSAKSFFRKQSLKRRSNQYLGKITLAVPLPFKWYSILALFLVCLIVVFLLLGSYSATEKSQGVIIPAGIKKVTGKSDTTITSILVKEGQKVSKGTPLLVLYNYKREDDDNEERMGRSRETLHEEDENYEDSEFSDNDLITGSGTDRKIERQNSNNDETSYEQTLKSPIDGIVYKLGYEIGDVTINWTAPVEIAVEGDLIIKAKVSAIVQANTKVGTEVLLILDAFKKKSIGRLSGTVISISMAPTKTLDPLTRQSTNIYKLRIKVDLTSSTFKREELLGKVVEIKLPLEKRKLYQWFFDPMKNIFSG
jgi:multidrug resistance efflux pump